MTPPESPIALAWQCWNIAIHSGDTGEMLNIVDSTYRVETMQSDSGGTYSEQIGLFAQARRLGLTSAIVYAREIADRQSSERAQVATFYQLGMEIGWESDFSKREPKMLGYSRQLLLIFAVRNLTLMIIAGAITTWLNTKPVVFVHFIPPLYRPIQTLLIVKFAKH